MQLSTRHSFPLGRTAERAAKEAMTYVALITVALGTPLAAGGRAAAGSPANGGKMVVARGWRVAGGEWRVRQTAKSRVVLLIIT